MAEWSQLPPELLLLIVKHLTTRFDVLRFRSVCPSWRSSLPPEVNPLRSLERSQVDFVRNTFYLVRPTRSCDGDQTEAPACCWFVKIRETTDRVKLQPLHTSFREDMWCPGKVIDLTSFQVVELGHEYLVTFYDSLPKEYFENKLVFLPTHTGGRDTGFIMFNLHRLYGVPFLRLGDKEWTWLPDLDDVQDIISFNGKVYAITRGGRTRIIDQSLKVSFFGDVSCSRTDKFLVKSVDDLLVVEMLNRPYDVDEITVRFRVFRMNEEEQKWDEIGSLRDQILFVGSVQAISVSASDFGWDKGNLIFYPIALSFRIPSEYPTFEEYFDYEVWFVFDLETGTSTAHPQNGPGYRNLLFRPPRQWFTCPESSISGTQVISNSTHSTTPTTSVTTEEKEVDGGARR